MAETGVPIGPPEASFAPALGPPVELPEPPRRPGPALHVGLFLVALVVWAGVGFGATVLAASLVVEDLYFAESALEADLALASIVGGIVFALYGILTMGVVASRVGYRLRDGLLVLVPIYSYVFTVRIWWRWASLPDRYWDERLDDRKHGGDEGSLPDPSAVTRYRGARLLVAIGVAIVIAIPLVLWIERTSSTSGGSETWEVASVRGMSVELPAGFDVFTNAETYARALDELDEPTATETAEMFRQFPEFFVLAAIEPIEGDRIATRTLVIQRFPVPGMTLEESVASFEEGATEIGFEITAKGEERVGAGGYPAMRLENEGQIAGLGPVGAVDYLVHDEGQVWVLEFSAPQDHFEDSLPGFDRILSTLTLP